LQKLLTQNLLNLVTVHEGCGYLIPEIIGNGFVGKFYIFM